MMVYRPLLHSEVYKRAVNEKRLPDAAGVHAMSKKIKLVESAPPWRDLATEWEDLYKPTDRTPATPRQILRGLAASQDDVR